MANKKVGISLFNYLVWIKDKPDKRYKRTCQVPYSTFIADLQKDSDEEIDVDDKELDKKSGNKIKLVKGFMRLECLELFKKRN